MIGRNRPIIRLWVFVLLHSRTVHPGLVVLHPPLAQSILLPPAAHMYSSRDVACSRGFPSEIPKIHKSKSQGNTDAENILLPEPLDWQINSPLKATFRRPSMLNRPLV